MVLSIYISFAKSIIIYVYPFIIPQTRITSQYLLQIASKLFRGNDCIMQLFPPPFPVFDLPKA